LDKTTVTDVGEEVDKVECRNKIVESEVKVEDQTGVSKVKVSQNVYFLFIS